MFNILLEEINDKVMSAITYFKEMINLTCAYFAMEFPTLS